MPSWSGSLVASVRRHWNLHANVMGIRLRTVLYDQAILQLSTGRCRCGTRLDASDQRQGVYRNHKTLPRRAGPARRWAAAPELCAPERTSTRFAIASARAPPTGCLARHCRMPIGHAASSSSSGEICQPRQQRPDAGMRTGRRKGRPPGNFRYAFKSARRFAARHGSQVPPDGCAASRITPLARPGHAADSAPDALLARISSRRSPCPVRAALGAAGEISRRSATMAAACVHPRRASGARKRNGRGVVPAQFIEPDAEAGDPDLYLDRRRHFLAARPGGRARRRVDRRPRCSARRCRTVSRHVLGGSTPRWSRPNQPVATATRGLDAP